eukprot:504760-Pleurochrysis_carterae.AAC.1
MSRRKRARSICRAGASSCRLDLCRVRFKAVCARLHRAPHPPHSSLARSELLSKTPCVVRRSRGSHSDMSPAYPFTRAHRPSFGLPTVSPFTILTLVHTCSTLDHLLQSFHYFGASCLCISVGFIQRMPVLRTLRTRFIFRHDNPTPISRRSFRLPTLLTPLFGAVVLQLPSACSRPNVPAVLTRLLHDLVMLAGQERPDDHHQHATVLAPLQWGAHLGHSTNLLCVLLPVFLPAFLRARLCVSGTMETDACVHVCARACMRACVHACVRACVRERASARASRCARIASSCFANLSVSPISPP